MNTLVIGDLHGEYRAAEKALDFPGKVVFVGDYLDSYTLSVEDQIKTLTLVLDACESEPERVTGLLGNHELSYIGGLHMCCSGYKGQTAAAVTLLKEKMEKHLKSYTWVNGFLVTHAGVSNKLLEDLGISLEEYLNIESLYEMIGRARGGRNSYGGLYWCDWWQEFEPITEVSQIVGHSAYRPSIWDEGIVTKHTRSSDNYNIDCINKQKPQVLVVDENSYVEIRDFNFK